MVPAIFPFKQAAMKSPIQVHRIGLCWHKSELRARRAPLEQRDRLDQRVRLAPPDRLDHQVRLVLAGLKVRLARLDRLALRD